MTVEAEVITRQEKRELPMTVGELRRVLDAFADDHPIAVEERYDDARDPAVKCMWLYRKDGEWRNPEYVDGLRPDDIKRVLVLW